MSDLSLIPGALAQDCYPSSPQALYDEMFSKGHAVGDNIKGLLIQDNTPDPEDQDKGWIKTAGGVPLYPGYVFVWHIGVGHWVARNPIDPSDVSRRIYVGNSADVGTYDHGDANPPGIATGPMWEIDTAFDGRVPVGAGKIPGTSPDVTIGVQQTQDSDLLSGEYKHILTGAEGGVGDHVHPIGNGNAGAGAMALNFVTPDVVTPNYTEFGVGGGATGAVVATANLFTLKANDGNGEVSDGHLNMQPYYGVFFIKRTGRQFYVAA